MAEIQSNMKGTRRKSRSLARTSVRLPSGKATFHYRRRSARMGTCSSCGLPLRSTPTNRAWKLAKSNRSPTRPYGGSLCHRCLSSEIRRLARASNLA
ncbi:50S ribosomal protein L34e [Candidatus Bathyarchaeota archaeon]|nr:MAG: 50S ribosomal protein L34e [Candidatus Bathyarchaeota archaeon]